MKKTTYIYAVPVVIFVISLIASTIYFRTHRRSVTLSVVPAPTDSIAEPADDDLLTLDDTMPRDQVCPLNGGYYTQAEKDSWETRRPLAVMIENTPEARPQSGLTNADIVFEAVAEGGITRFMAFFYCDAQREDVTLAPIRSARTYFINLASGFNFPMYVHVGGANVEGPTNALGQLSEYGWNSENDVNQFSVGYPTFIRDYNRIPGQQIATEHTMTTTTEKLWALAAKRGWTNVTPVTTATKKTTGGESWQDGYEGWSFADGKPGSGSQTISYNFWSGQPVYDVAWKYNATDNTYLRDNGGSPALDLNNDEQIAVSNVVVMFVEETGPINDKKHMIYEVIGKGDGLLFHDGQVEEIAWSKKSRTDELVFTDSKGKDIELTRGKVWVSVLPEGNKVTY